MPTTYPDQFFVIDPYNGLPAGTAMQVNFLDMVDRNNDGWISTGKGDRVDGFKVTDVYVGDTVTVVMNGVTVTITGTTFYLQGSPAVFTPTDGTVLSNATFVSSSWVSPSTQVQVNSFGPPCFTAGTMILTDRGQRAIEDLQVGDLVQTMDHGLQAVRWIGRSPTDGRGDHAPVVFKPGAIGNDVELRVSPQHRVLVQGWQAELFFGCDEVLVPAKHLINGDDIVQEPVDEVLYFHLMFDRHEVICSNGTMSESFFPGDQIMLQDRGVRAELLALFPELCAANSPFRQTARATVKRREARLLALVA
jgi:Hint domain